MGVDAILILIGLFFLGGLVADTVGHRTRLPRVTLLLGLGIIAGKSGFDVMPAATDPWFEFFSVLALTMVAFLLGAGLTWDKLSITGREVMVLSIVLVIGTMAIVSTGLAALGAGVTLALVLGALACATDPAATQDTITQAGSTSVFSEKLKAVVAIDDAWGLIAFSLAVVAAKGLNGAVDWHLLIEALYEIGGSFVLGCAIGFPAAYLTGRVRPGEPVRSEVLGLVFLTAGLALWLHMSYLIAAMTAGAVISNFARHHTRAVHEIERIQWPFMIVFFILAGAALQLDALLPIGLLGAGYVVLRIAARFVAGWLGAWMGGAPRHERAWFGPALLPQAGVAVGMALVAAQEFPEIAETVLNLTIGATVVFEILGPVVTLFVLRKVDGKAKPRGRGDAA